MAVRGRSVLFSVRTAVVVTAAALFAIWLVQAINAADAYRLDGDLGLSARSLGSLPHIIAVPFLHVSVEHIESNSVPLASPRSSWWSGAWGTGCSGRRT
jgi:membrane associated rhomboid family serine protease